jgi:hypothetical protein
MGYIKEPKGIDLIIPPSTFTDKDLAEIAEFIRKDKLKKKRSVTKQSVREPSHK